MTQSGHGHGASPDLLGRDFAAAGPNRKWLCDITYIPTDEGFLYLAGVMDAWSRSIVGWSMSDSLHASVALDALRSERGSTARSATSAPRHRGAFLA